MSTTNPFDKTILLSLTVNMPGNSRQASKASVTVDSDPELWTINKKLYECEEFKNITKVKAAITKFLKYKKLHVQIIKDGIYPIPLKFVEDVEQFMPQQIAQFHKACNTFFENYNDIVKKQTERLNVLAETRDYPPLDVIKRKFAISYNWLSIGVPEQLGSISHEAYKKAQAKAQQQWKELTEAARDSLRELFQELVTHMADILKPQKDGKPKKFHQSSIDNFQEFLKNFEPCNIANDTELSALIKKAEAYLEGKTADGLKNSTLTRNTTQKAMEDIKSSLNLLVTKGGRAEILSA